MATSDLNSRKETGAHYTPPELAAFVAESMLEQLGVSGKGLRILDPAIGDGSLMEALLLRLETPHVAGFDTDADAVAAAGEKLGRLVPSAQLNIMQADFLEYCLQRSGSDLFATERIEQFDLVIANPPYVRTQVMGAEKAQKLAESFELSGRVDLYFSFLICIARVLRAGGVAGVIVSNRFMTTRSGVEVRKRLLQDFDILQIVDFGDTKLFEAAVLPVVLILRKKDVSRPSEAETRYSAIYTTAGDAETFCSTVFEALRGNGNVQVNGEKFLVRHGTLDCGDDTGGVWRLATDCGDAWLEAVKKRTHCAFGDIGKVRVGVKTTADKIFIRRDWDSMPSEDQPELLRPLITHHNARRYRADMTVNPAKILYTHESVDGRKRAVDLKSFPRAAAYLNSHRVQLEARSYVIEAGRNWFEIWVPQDPAVWKMPKLVFPDISERPMFCVDVDGAVVNGDCYWVAAKNGVDTDLLWLAVGVGNSTFIEEYYDHVFHNKLYSGRRRFMTQYVERFPLPDPQSSQAREIVALAKEVHAAKTCQDACHIEHRINMLVLQAFGLSIEEIAR